MSAVKWDDFGQFLHILFCTIIIDIKKRIKRIVFEAFLNKNDSISSCLDWCEVFFKFVLL